MEKINSEYVAICDVDDLSLDERFNNQIKFLESNLGMGLLDQMYF